MSAKVDLTLSEDKNGTGTKVDLTLESKGQGYTWEPPLGTWGDYTRSTWASQRVAGSKESKTKDDLTLENK